jgi:hypothetical protein
MRGKTSPESVNLVKEFCDDLNSLLGDKCSNVVADDWGRYNNFQVLIVFPHKKRKGGKYYVQSNMRGIKARISNLSDSDEYDDIFIEDVEHPQYNGSVEGPGSMRESPYTVIDLRVM